MDIRPERAPGALDFDRFECGFKQCRTRRNDCLQGAGAGAIRGERQCNALLGQRDQLRFITSKRTLETGMFSELAFEFGSVQAEQGFRVQPAYLVLARENAWFLACLAEHGQVDADLQRDHV